MNNVETFGFAATGGRDSRTTLSVLNHAGIDFKMFSFDHEYISKGDTVVPRMLADASQKEYRFVHRNTANYSKQRESDYVTHCAGMAEDADKLFYIYDQYHELDAGENAVIINSGIYEATVPDYLSLDKIVEGAKRNDLLEKSINDWLLRAEEDQKNCSIEISNRAYLDLRAGCWLSSIEQSLDIIDGITSIHPINCRYLISLLMGYDRERRMNKAHEELITVTACPSFKEIPYDSDFKSESRYRSRLRRLSASLRTFGIKNTITWVFSRFQKRLGR